MGDDLRVTVIATGFDSSHTTGQRAARRARSRTEAKAQSGNNVGIPIEEFQPQAIDVNDLDIPAFLRRR
jgi:cell division GTPase FtsZ